MTEGVTKSPPGWNVIILAGYYGFNANIYDSGFFVIFLVIFGNSFSQKMIEMGNFENLMLF